MPFVTPSIRRRTPIIAALALALLAALASPLAARAADGVQDFSFASASGPSSPTGDKPQSKLWFNDGSWWGSLWGGSSFDIQRFDPATQSWIDTGTAIDQRSKSQADMLWDGTHLYALSSIRQGGATNDPSVRLARFSYDPGARTYSLDAGFPVTVFTPASSDDLETAVIDKDSTGQLWATFTYANQPGSCATPSACTAGRSVYVAHSTSDDAHWASLVLPVAGASDVSGDDISTLVHFGSRTGVLFSDQTPDANRETADDFAWHADGAPADRWTLEQPLHGVGMADDHLDVKAAPDGRVFAAVKTSRNDLGAGHDADPLVLLLVRATNGTWTQTTFDTVDSQDTRSQVVLDPSAGTVYQLATFPPNGTYEAGGWIYCKSTSMDAPAYPTGRGFPLIDMGPSDTINNVSTTKQPIDASTGLLAIAADDRSGFYFHSFLALTPTPCAPAPAPPGGGGGSGTTPVTGARAKVSIHLLRRSLRSVRRHRRLPVRVTAGGPMQVGVYARLSVGRRSVTVALARVRFTRARTRVVALRLTKTGRRRLAHRRRAKLRIVVHARGSDGRLVARAARITLR